MSKALQDITVLDLTQWEAGPTATQLMGFLGANVIKIEPPKVGDPARRFSGVPLEGDVDSFYFITLNANKKSITLDLDKARGREIFKEMVKKGDVVVENFEAGTMEKWGLNYDVLKEINPKLIYGRVSGYGSYGPYADYPADDSTIQAMTGTTSWTGFPDKPPVRGGPRFAETGSGVNLCSGILMALHQRDREGKGEFVEVTMADTSINLCRVRLTAMQTETDQMYKGPPIKRLGIVTGSRAPSNIYPTKDQDIYINFMYGAAQDQWEMTMKLIGHPELVGDPRFADQYTRGKHSDVVDKLLSDWTSQRSGAEAFNTLAGAGISTGITLTSSMAMNDPHILYREKVVELDHPVRGKYKMLGYAGRLEKSPVEIRTAPLLGEHNEEVYAELMGYTKDDLSKLKTAGVI